MTGFDAGWHGSMYDVHTVCIGWGVGWDDIAKGSQMGPWRTAGMLGQVDAMKDRWFSFFFQRAFYG